MVPEPGFIDDKILILNRSFRSSLRWLASEGVSLLDDKQSGINQ